jgi:hypothetical protein
MENYECRRAGEATQSHAEAKAEGRMQNAEWGSRPEIDWYFGTRKKKYHDCNSL